MFEELPATGNPTGNFFSRQTNKIPVQGDFHTLVFLFIFNIITPFPVPGWRAT